jgi:hypothetical protein
VDVDRRDLAVRRQAAANARRRLRPVVGLGQVARARPHELDRELDPLRDRGCLDGEVGDGAPAERSPAERGVDEHVVAIDPELVADERLDDGRRLAR